jgi:alkylated DNA repair dioxygenase AlkB
MAVFHLAIAMLPLTLLQLRYCDIVTYLNLRLNQSVTRKTELTTGTKNQSMSKKRLIDDVAEVVDVVDVEDDDDNGGDNDGDAEEEDGDDGGDDDDVDDDDSGEKKETKRRKSSKTVASESLVRVINEVPGLFLCEEFIDKATESSLLAFFDSEPWSSELKRRVLHYGFKYNYKSRNISDVEIAPSLPDSCRRLASQLAANDCLRDAGCSDLVGTVFDQLIVNEYLPGQGISAHTDSPVFGACIASVSMGSGVVMRFSRNGHACCEVWLPRRSVVVLTGDARRLWKHSIAPVKSDKCHGARSRRVSLTFRTLLRVVKSQDK